jgi:hypothetical protein
MSDVGHDDAGAAPVIKPVRTEADFAQMGWHDDHVHAVAL